VAQRDPRVTIQELDMENVIREFVARFNRSEQSMGRIDYVETPIALADSNLLPAGSDIRQFYQHVVLDDSPTLGGDFFLQFFTVDELADAQSGWTGPDDETWPWKQSFVRVADRSGDALVVDAAQPQSPVYGSIQHYSFPVAASFTALLGALSIGIDIEEVEFGGDTRDDDMGFKPAFLARVEAAVTDAGEDVNVAGFMKFFFG